MASIETITDKISDHVESLVKTVEAQTRKDFADELIGFTKRSGNSHTRGIEDLRTMVVGAHEDDQPYVPGLPRDWEPTKDFLDGLRFAAAILRDKNYDL